MFSQFSGARWLTGGLTDHWASAGPSFGTFPELVCIGFSFALASPFQEPRSEDKERSATRETTAKNMFRQSGALNTP